MYTLYYSPGACSLAIHALLHSLALPFKTVRIDINSGQNRTTEYLKLNPRGQVPTLTINNNVLRESAAIAIYIADKYKSPLLPQEDLERFQTLEWLEFYNSSLQQAYGSYFLMAKNLKDENVKQMACELAARRISFLWREVESHLSQNRYLCGDTLTLSDLFHAVIANWTMTITHKIVLSKNILRLCKKVTELPYFQQALQDEGLTYALPF